MTGSNVWKAAAKTHSLLLKYIEDSGDCGIKLRWKTSTQTPEVIPGNLVFPAREFNHVIEQIDLLHRAALMISGINISDAEILHLVSSSNPFVVVDFDNIGIEQWRRFRDYRVLTESVPQSQTQLTELFEYSNRLEQIPETEEAIQPSYLKLVD